MVGLNEEERRMIIDLNTIPEEEKEDGNSKARSFIPFQKAIGFTFAPSDLELIIGYLKPFSEELPLPQHKIHIADIYSFHPSELSERFERGNEKDFFFFTPGIRLNGRVAKGGYWHATTGTSKLTLGGRPIGELSKFTFWNAKTSEKDARKTDWLMTEYRLIKTSSVVLTKIYNSKMDKGAEKGGKDYAVRVEKQQALVVKHETLWQEMQSCSAEKYPKRNRF